MEAWIQDFFHWLPTGALYYALVFFISFCESLAFAGIIVPGSTLIVFTGFLAANGKGAYGPLMVAATFGAILGDLLSYWLGARMGADLLARPLFRRYRELFRKSQIFFFEHGGKSVFFGRFIGLIRPFIPFVAGYARMRPGLFAFYAVVSGILWGLAYPGLGYFFGTSWQRVELWAGRFSYLLAALAVLLAANHLFWRKLAPRLWSLGPRLQARFSGHWHSLLKRPAVRRLKERHPGLWAFLADRFDPRHSAGLFLTAGFAGVLLFSVLFILLVGPFPRLDQSIHQSLAGLRHPVADPIALFITYLGNGPVIALLGLWANLWLLLRRRYFSILLLTGGTLAGELLVYLFKLFFARPRPASPFIHLVMDLHGFPSAHAFVALVFYGLLVYMLLDTLNHLEKRFYLVVGGSLLTLLIGFSRLYLGVHWFSDVLGGYALAAAWLSLLITAGELRRRTGEFPWGPAPARPALSPGRRRLYLALAAIPLLWALWGYVDYRLERDLGPRQRFTTTGESARMPADKPVSSP
ncbi:MAG: bifunctional DedA family/phosphatase PAP2 family protein [Trichloromonas sp.]|jgi:undecaprenyl-diphosphatase|nr:bifunctional DedA family/phosphatase PAP2 family protein [Trichloromonas sp.]